MQVFNDERVDTLFLKIHFQLPKFELPQNTKPKGAVLYNLINNQIYYSDGTGWHTINGGTSDRPIHVTDTTQSTSPSTGAVIIDGGMGVGKNVFIGGILYVDNYTQSTSTTTGAAVIAGGLGVGGNETLGGILNVTNTTNSTSTSTGSIVTAGGIGIAGNETLGGVLNVTNTTPSTSPSTGAAVVAGGVGIGNNLIVGSTTNSTTTTTTGAIVTPGGLGVGGNETIGGILNVINTTNSTSTSTGAAVIAGGVGIAGNETVGGVLNVTNTAQSNSSNTGAIISSGGLGVAGNVHTGGIIYGDNTAQSTSTSTGAIITPGGLGVGGNTNIGGIVNVTNTTNSTSTSTGAIVTPGGLGVGGNANIGGTLSSSVFATDSLILNNPGSDPYYYPITYNNPEFTTLSLVNERITDTLGFDTPTLSSFSNPLSTYVVMETYDVFIDWIFLDAIYFNYVSDALSGTGAAPDVEQPVNPESDYILPVWAQNAYRAGNLQLWRGAPQSRMRITKVGRMCSLQCMPVFFADSQKLQGGFFTCTKPHIPARFLPVTYGTEINLGPIMVREFNSMRYYHGFLNMNESLVGNPRQNNTNFFTGDSEYTFDNLGEPGRNRWAYPNPGELFLFVDAQYGTGIPYNTTRIITTGPPVVVNDLAAYSVLYGTSSLRIGPGTSLLAFDGTFLTGNSITFNVNMNDLSAVGWNDRIKSLMLTYDPTWNQKYVSKGLNVFFAKNQASSSASSGDAMGYASIILTHIAIGYAALGSFNIIIAIASYIINLVALGFSLASFISGSGDNINWGNNEVHFPDPNSDGNHHNEDYYWDSWCVSYITDV